MTDAQKNKLHNTLDDLEKTKELTVANRDKGQWVSNALLLILVAITSSALVYLAMTPKPGDVLKEVKEIRAKVDVLVERINRLEKQ